MSLKDRLKRFTIQYPALEHTMYRYYRLRNGHAGDLEIERRRQLSIFELEQLSAELPYAPEERVIDNNLYGYGRYLKEFANITTDLKSYLEHGLFLGRIVHEDQYHWHFPRVITMSEHRREILREKLPEKESLAVGPYIHYTRGILSDEAFKSLKEDLGRTLLVYPFHSMKKVKAGFDDQDLIAEIKKVARDFDSVLICLYYLDARDEEKCEAYRREGFRLVTAGHRYDRHFVARQRTHIELADLTMSNGMGTQTGYCVYLKKPHYIFGQSIEQNALSASEKKRFLTSSGGDERELVAFQRSYFSRLFSELRSDISDEQYEATARLWGFDDIKTPQEIRDFIA